MRLLFTILILLCAAVCQAAKPGQPIQGAFGLLAEDGRQLLADGPPGQFPNGRHLLRDNGLGNPFWTNCFGCGTNIGCATCTNCFGLVTNGCFVGTCYDTNGTGTSVVFCGGGGASSVTSYWTFEESSGTRLDAVFTNHLSVESGAPSFTSGLVGNCLKLNDFSGAVSVYGKLPLPAAGFNFAQWYRKKNNSSFSTLASLQWYTTDTYTALADLTLTLNISSGSSGSITVSYSAWISGAIDHQSSLNVSSSTVDTWHLLRTWVDPIAGTVRLTIDEANSKTNSFIYSPATPLHCYIRFGPGVAFGDSTALLLDEAGFWPFQLSDADGTYLYNSGAGRTYPDVPYP